jgi:hypothetical protein
MALRSSSQICIHPVTTPDQVDYDQIFAFVCSLASNSFFRGPANPKIYAATFRI